LGFESHRNGTNSTFLSTHFFFFGGGGGGVVALGVSDVERFGFVALQKIAELFVWDLN
jgi:hypothetical protein